MAVLISLLQKLPNSGWSIAQWVSEGKQPWCQSLVCQPPLVASPHWHLGKDVIDEVRRRFDHPPRAAGRAEAAAFAGKGNKVFVAAAVALHADEPVLEPATTQVVLAFMGSSR